MAFKQNMIPCSSQSFLNRCSRVMCLICLIDRYRCRIKMMVFHLVATGGDKGCKPTSHCRSEMRDRPGGLKVCTMSRFLAEWTNAIGWLFALLVWSSSVIFWIRATSLERVIFRRVRIIGLCETLHDITRFFTQRSWYSMQNSYHLLSAHQRMSIVWYMDLLCYELRIQIHVLVVLLFLDVLSLFHQTAKGG